MMETATRRHSTGGIILIALGVFFLAITLTDSRSWGFMLGLGLAFLIGYLWSNGYGWLVSGAILTAVGAFGLLDHNRWLLGQQAAGFDRGLTFIFILGLGFTLTYILGRRWHLWWPLIPGLGLLWLSIAPGLFVYTGWWTLEEWSMLARLWPLLLMVAGAWVALRSIVPARYQQAARIAAVVVTVALCLLVATGIAAAMAAGGPPLHFLRPDLREFREYRSWR